MAMSRASLRGDAMLTFVLAIVVWFLSGIVIGFIFGRTFAPDPWGEIQKAASDVRMTLFTGRQL
jgi:hypothetical protein